MSSWGILRVLVTSALWMHVSAFAIDHEVPSAGYPAADKISLVKQTPAQIREFLTAVAIAGGLDESARRWMQTLDFDSAEALRRELAKGPPSNVASQAWEKSVAQMRADLAGDELSQSRRRTVAGRNSPDLEREISDRIADLTFDLETPNRFATNQLRYLEKLREQLKLELAKVRVAMKRTATSANPRTASDYAALYREDPRKFIEGGRHDDRFSVLAKHLREEAANVDDIAAYWTAYRARRRSGAEASAFPASAPGVKMLVSEVELLLEMPELDEIARRRRLRELGPHLRGFAERVRDAAEPPPGISKARWARARELALASVGAVDSKTLPTTSSFVGCPARPARWTKAEVLVHLKVLEICRPEKVEVAELVSPLDPPALSALQTTINSLTRDELVHAGISRDVRDSLMSEIDGHLIKKNPEAYRAVPSTYVALTKEEAEGWADRLHRVLWHDPSFDPKKDFAPKSLAEILAFVKERQEKAKKKEIHPDEGLPNVVFSALPADERERARLLCDAHLAATNQMFSGPEKIEPLFKAGLEKVGLSEKDRAEWKALFEMSKPWTNVVAKDLVHYRAPEEMFAERLGFAGAVFGLIAVCKSYKDALFARNVPADAIAEPFAIGVDGNLGADFEKAATELGVGLGILAEQPDEVMAKLARALADPKKSALAKRLLVTLVRPTVVHKMLTPSDEAFHYGNYLFIPPAKEGGPPQVLTRAEAIARENAARAKFDAAVAVLPGLAASSDGSLSLINPEKFRAHLAEAAKQSTSKTHEALRTLGMEKLLDPNRRDPIALGDVVLFPLTSADGRHDIKVLPRREVEAMLMLEARRAQHSGDDAELLGRAGIQLNERDGVIGIVTAKPHELGAELLRNGVLLQAMNRQAGGLGAALALEHLQDVAVALRARPFDRGRFLKFYQDAKHVGRDIVTALQWADDGVEKLDNTSVPAELKPSIAAWAQFNLLRKRLEAQGWPLSDAQRLQFLETRAFLFDQLSRFEIAAIVGDAGGAWFQGHRGKRYFTEYSETWRAATPPNAQGQHPPHPLARTRLIETELATVEEAILGRPLRDEPNGQTQVSLEKLMLTAAKAGAWHLEADGLKITRGNPSHQYFYDRVQTISKAANRLALLGAPKETVDKLRALIKDVSNAHASLTEKSARDYESRAHSAIRDAVITVATLGLSSAYTLGRQMWQVANTGKFFLTAARMKSGADSVQLTYRAWLAQKAGQGVIAAGAGAAAGGTSDVLTQVAKIADDAKIDPRDPRYDRRKTSIEWEQVGKATLLGGGLGAGLRLNPLVMEAGTVYLTSAGLTAGYESWKRGDHITGVTEASLAAFSPLVAKQIHSRIAGRAGTDVAVNDGPGGGGGVMSRTRTVTRVQRARTTDGRIVEVPVEETITVQEPVGPPATRVANPVPKPAHWESMTGFEKTAWELAHPAPSAANPAPNAGGKKLDIVGGTGVIASGTAADRELLEKLQVGLATTANPAVRKDIVAGFGLDVIVGALPSAQKKLEALMNRVTHIDDVKKKLDALAHDIRGDFARPKFEAPSIVYSSPTGDSLDLGPKSDPASVAALRAAAKRTHSQHEVSGGTVLGDSPVHVIDPAKISTDLRERALPHAEGNLDPETFAAFALDPDKLAKHVSRVKAALIALGIDPTKRGATEQLFPLSLQEARKGIEEFLPAKLIAPVATVTDHYLGEPAALGSNGVVRVGKLRDGRLVAIKEAHFPSTPADFAWGGGTAEQKREFSELFLGEMAGDRGKDVKDVLQQAQQAWVLSELGIGPKFHGLTVTASGIGFVTDIIAGDGGGNGNQRSARDLAKLIERTRDFKIGGQSYMITHSEFQFLVTGEGHVMPFDPSGTIVALPADTEGRASYHTSFDRAAEDTRRIFAAKLGRNIERPAPDPKPPAPVNLAAEVKKAGAVAEAAMPARDPKLGNTFWTANLHWGMEQRDGHVYLVAQDATLAETLLGDLFGDKASRAKKANLADIGGTAFEVTDLLNPAVAHVLGKVIFDGPNCYNLSLLHAGVAGGLQPTDENELAHWLSSPLSQPVQKLGDAKRGDLIVYGNKGADGKFTPTHAAVYFSPRVVITKDGGYQTTVPRIGTLDEVTTKYGPEANEIRIYRVTPLKDFAKTNEKVIPNKLRDQMAKLEKIEKEQTELELYDTPHYAERDTMMRGLVQQYKDLRLELRDAHYALKATQKTRPAQEYATLDAIYTGLLKRLDILCNL